MFKHSKVWLFTALAIISMLVVACGAPVEPQVVKETVVVEKEVEVEVEKEVVVTEIVEVEKEVEVEVEKEVVVTEIVEVEKEVEVEVEKEVVVTEIVEVEKVIVAECDIDAPTEATSINMIGWAFPITEFYAEELERCNPVENLEVNTQLLDSAGAKEQVRLGLSGGGDSPYAIVHGANGDLVEWGSQDWLMPLNDMIEKYGDEYDLDDIPATAWEGATYEGNIYGIPIVGNTLHMMYRIDLFEQYELEPPTTYDEVIAACEVLKDESSIDVPFTMNLHAGWAWEIEFFHFLESFEGTYLDGDNMPAFDGPEGVAAINKMKEVIDGCMGAEGLSFSTDDSEIGMETGSLAFVNLWASRAANMDDPEKSDFVDGIGFAPAAAPNPDGALGGSAWNDFYMIPATTDVDPEVAFQVIMEAADLQSQEKAAKYGIVTRQAVGEAGIGGRYLPAAGETIANGVGIYAANPAIALVRTALGEALPLVATGEMTAEDALAAAAEAYIEEATAQGFIGDGAGASDGGDEEASEEAAMVSMEPGCNIDAPADAVSIDMIGWAFPIMEFYVEQLELCNEVDNIEVNAQLLDSAGAQEQVRLALSGGGESPYGIVHGANTQVVEWGEQGWFMPLNDMIEKYGDQYDLSDIPATAWEGATYDGNIYGIPVVGNTLHQMYRIDLFEEYGLEPPTTYDEVMAACEVLKDEPSIDLPFTMNLHAGWAWEIEFFHFLGSFEGTYLDGDNMPAFDGPEGVAALDKMKEVIDTCMGVEGLSYSTDDSEIGMETGALAFVNLWASRAANMDDPEKSDFVDGIGFAPAAAPNPGGALGGSAWNDFLMIPATTDVDPELLFQVIMSAADLESQQNAAEFGIVTRQAVGEAGIGGRYLPAAGETIANGVGIYEANPAIALVRTVLGEALPLVGNGDMTSEEALAAAAEAYIEEATAQGFIGDGADAGGDEEATEEEASEEAAMVSMEPGCNIEAPADAATLNIIGWAFPIMEFYAEQLELCNEVENIEINTQLLDAAGAREQVRLGLSGGGESPYAILHGANGDIVEWAAEGWVQPIDDLVEKYWDEYDLADIPQAAWDGASFGGEIYGIPIVGNSLHLMYRPDLFEKYDLEVPTTYDEVMAACEVLKDEPSIDLPFTMNLHAGWAWEIEFFHFLGSFGGEYLNDDNSPAFNSPEGAAALAKMVEVADTCMGAEGLSYSVDDSEIGMEVGSLAFVQLWASRAAGMDDPEKSDFVGGINFAPAAAPNPGGALGGSAWNDFYMIPATTDVDRDLIFQVIMSAADLESQQNAAELGIVTREAVGEAGIGGRYLSASAETIANGVGIYESNPAIPLVRTALGNSLPLVATGDMTPEEALQAAADEYLAEAEAQGFLE